MQLSTSDRRITLTREIGAPRELVYSAWTDPEHLAHWFGPSGFTTRTHSIELRTGGAWRFEMIGPDGHVYQNRVIYTSVNPPSELAYRHVAADGVEPVCFDTRITFDQVAGNPGRTLMRMVMDFPTAEHLREVVEKYGALEGAKQNAQRLDEFVSRQRSGALDDRAFVISRVFDAPIELVWDVWTSREHLQQWFGPKIASITSCSLDFRVGGMFLYGMRFEGGEHWGRWVFRDIQRPSRLEFLTSFADAHGEIVRHPWNANWPLEMHSVVTFEPHAGVGRGTLVTVRWKPHNASPSEVETFFRGMESMGNGWSGTFDKLGEHLARR